MIFLAESSVLPPPADPERAESAFKRWTEITVPEPSTESSKIYALAEDPAGRKLLSSIFGNSPWLTHCALSDPAFLYRTATAGPDAAIDTVTAQLAAESLTGTGREAMMMALRKARMQTALAVAVADISGTWSVARVTGVLSRFADMAVQRALDCLFAEAAAQGEISPSDDVSPSRGGGLFILGLGKLGACELNYSSDIDIIALFDPERVPYTGRRSPQEFCVRVVRDLVGLLENRTRDGYVCRTDLRLRPDPGSTPLAVSTLAAETYYESTGQNWERAAFIKARVIAGDHAAGEDFLRILDPFLWRKNLDFAAIQDIHSIKRQINAHRGGSEIAVNGHNLKLGRGGIREIEFFAQTQQLIWGGRVPELRSRATCDTLAALAREGRITAEVRDELTTAYNYLRRAEHRLQMVDDRQTHSLPDDDSELERFSLFLGYEDTGGFAEDLLGHLHRVEHHYGHLFEESAPLSGPGNLVFTGADDDPDTLATLAEMGFSDGSAVSERIRNWHRGRYRATRSSRARELLTELVPTLLDTLSGTASPDSAFRNFDAFLAALPAGVQLFSLLIANPNLMQLVAEIMGSAPRLATSLAAQPSLLDSVIEGDFYGPLEDRATLAESLDGTLAVARDYEDVLERSRRFANDQKFRIGMRILGGELDADSAGAALSDLADVVVAKLLEVDSADMEAKHGRVPDCGMCVVALGKLGGREITENSDLDLLLVYGSGEEGEEEDGVTNSSDGKRPLVASQYFARLAQQLITAVSAPTSEGKLYEVDMRLRPSGNAGPIATSLAAFSRYQDTQAWTWEHMALTRARVLAGPPGLGSRIAARIAEILCRPRDEKKLKDDVLEMRGRLARGHPGQSPWDVKYIDGGIIDVEFIAQYLQLYHGHTHPEVLATKTADALTALHGAGVLDSDTAVRLIQAERLWRTIQGMLRFTFEGSFDEDAAPMGLKSALVRATGMDDFNDLKLNMTNTAGWVRATFLALIGKPIQP